MYSLSTKQNRVLRFIGDFGRKQGYAPSFREIGAAVGGIKSSTVAYYIKVLKKKGTIKQDPSKARALKLASPASIPGQTESPTRSPSVAVRKQSQPAKAPSG